MIDARSLNGRTADTPYNTPRKPEQQPMHLWRDYFKKWCSRCRQDKATKGGKIVGGMFRCAECCQPKREAS